MRDVQLLRANTDRWISDRSGALHHEPPGDDHYGDVKPWRWTADAVNAESCRRRADVVQIDEPWMAISRQGPCLRSRANRVDGVSGTVANLCFGGGGPR